MRLIRRRRPVKLIASIFVDYQRAHFAAGFVVDENHWRTILAPHPIAAPSPHRGEHVPECLALIGQAVFVTRRTFFVRNFFQQAFVDQSIEPPRENCARNFQRALEVLEATTAGERFAHHKWRPPITNQVGGARDWARPLIKTSSPHQAIASIRAGTCLWNGVPANQSRSSVTVSSLGATPC